MADRSFVLTDESWLPVKLAIVQVFDLDDPDLALLEKKTDIGGVVTFLSADLAALSPKRFFFRPLTRRTSGVFGDVSQSGVLRLNEIIPF